MLNTYSDLNLYGNAPVVFNQPPVADAGANQANIGAGTLVTLDFSGSTDGDGTIVSYVVVQTAGDTVTLTAPTATTRTFPAPSTNASQTLTFELTVTDNVGDTHTDMVDIGILAIALDTTPPVINLSNTGPMNVTVGDSFTLPTITATDNTDGDLSGSVITTGSVNTNAVGTYLINFDVSDVAGNAAITTILTVNVVPQISDSGKRNLTFTVHFSQDVVKNYKNVWYD